MITKTLNVGFEQDGTPSVTLLDNGMGTRSFLKLHKIASEEKTVMEMAGITPKKGKSYVLLITAGAGEYYGPNNNGDYFNEDSKTVSFHAPEGASKLLLEGGLKKYHKTYMQIGGVYREHNNSRKGASPEGAVVWQRVNPVMHRGEVITELDNDKWGTELQNLAMGKPLFFSMGCGVPREVCSYCGHVSQKREDRCAHATHNLLGYMPSGHQIFLYNDAPHFHDISQVAKPADVTAFALEKVARDGASAEDALKAVRPYRLNAGRVIRTTRLLEKARRPILEKLACEERDMGEGIPLELSPVAQTFNLLPQQEDRVVSGFGNIPLEQLMSSTMRHNCLLSPRCFIRIIFKKRPEDIEGTRNLPEALKTVFTDILGSASEEDVLSDGSFCPSSMVPNLSVENKVRELSELVSLDPEPVRKRIIIITAGGPSKGSEESLDKEASTDEPTQVDKVLADSYARYALTYLANTQTDPRMAVLAARSGV